MLGYAVCKVSEVGWPSVEVRKMTRLEELEQEIRKLNRAELADLRERFRKYDSDEWDRRIEEDARGGKLDELVRKALAAHGAGKTREL